jgi:hypothetical protein
VPHGANRRIKDQIRREAMGVFEKLQKVQMEMKAPKNLYNSYGKYSYRNCESILEAFKPFGQKYGLVLTVYDKLHPVGDRIFIQSVATLTDVETGEDVTNTGYAEIGDHKGMSADQITGCASSYARKYCLNGLFLLDDTKDADTDEMHRIENPERPAPQNDRVQEADLRAKVLGYINKVKMSKESIDKICEIYKVKDIKDMNVQQCSHLIKTWEKKGVAV